MENLQKAGSRKITKADIVEKGQTRFFALDLRESSRYSTNLSDAYFLLRYIDHVRKSNNVGIRSRAETLNQS